jgi:hypothetical protein
MAGQFDLCYRLAIAWRVDCPMLCAAYNMAPTLADSVARAGGFVTQPTGYGEVLLVPLPPRSSSAGVLRALRRGQASRRLPRPFVINAPGLESADGALPKTGISHCIPEISTPHTIASWVVLTKCSGRGSCFKT